MASPAYIEKLVVAMLKGDAEVHKICAGRIYPLKIPQGTRLPAVVYQRFYSNPDYHLRGYDSEAVSLMVNSFCLTYEKTKELALAVRSVMAKAPINAILENEIDLYEDGADAFCINAQFLVQQSGGFDYV